MAKNSGDVLSPTTCAACRRAIAEAGDALPFIERLEAIAAVYPAILERVQDLRTRHQYLAAAAEAALAIDRIARDDM